MDYILSFLSNVWYWIRCHTYNRYHIINISGRAGYKWGWIDTDGQMLLVNFKLLCDFIEKECRGYFKLEPDEYWKQEALFLYSWWKEKELSTDWRITEPDYDEETQMLIRLIKIRENLWT